MIGLRQSPWKKLLENVRREFMRLDEEFLLLQSIDKYLNIGPDASRKSLEDLFQDSIDRFSTIHSLDSPLLCYVNVGSAFTLLNGNSADPFPPATIQITKSFDDFMSGDDPIAIDVSVLSPEDGDAVFNSFPDKSTILLCPLFSESKRLICVFLTADTDIRQVSHLSDSAFRNFVLQLVNQLAIAYIDHDRTLRHALWRNFVASDVSPEQSFQDAAKLIPDFLPDFGPLRVREDALPQVQILMLVSDPQGGPDELVIRGTTGAEPQGTRIAIDRSISGHLITSDLPYFCDDPAKPVYVHLFKKYLGKEIRTELVVRLVNDVGEPIGALNLESEMPDAFNVHHVDALLRLAKDLARVLMAYERRLQLNSVVQISIASSTARYLDGVAAVFRHTMNTPLTALRSNIESASTLANSSATEDVQRAVSLAAASPDSTELLEILTRVEQGLTRAGRNLERIRGAHSQISKYSADFARDISGYAATGPTNLRETLDAAIGLVKETIIAPLRQPIGIEFPLDQTTSSTRVYCSPLLKQHLYSLLHNSVLAIQARLRKDPTPGVISIEIRRNELPESQEVELNKSWAVSIRDDGTGVDSEQLSELRRFQSGVRFREGHGSGSGLVAAQQFMNSVGGRMDIDSEYGSFFKVTLHFYEEPPNV